MNPKTQKLSEPARERGDVAPAALMARAAEIASGAPLRFDRQQLIVAMHCFADFRGGVRRYLAKSKPGDPVPERWRYDSYLAGWKTTHEAVVEARAHLHAFPADDDDLKNALYLAENYIFTTDPDAGRLKPGFVATRKPLAKPAPQKIQPESEKKPVAGAGCWEARRMDVQWPGRDPGVMVEAIGIYNTATGHFKAQEYVGESMDRFMENNPDEDRDELEAIYWREAQDWARSHNSKGL